MDDLLDDFLAETNENLDSLTNDLVKWEISPADRSLLDGIFRFFHTIKGNSGFLEFERLGRLSHAAETAMARARDGGVVPDSLFVSAIFMAIDKIRAVLGVLADNRREPEGDDAELIARLEAVAAGRAIETPPENIPDSIAAQSNNNADIQNTVSPKAQQSTVRVAVGLLDRLMGLASELVLARNALLRSVRHGEEIPANLIEHVSACVTDLQDGINRTRMQPIEALWTPLPRVVRDLSKELGKELHLSLEGGDTEIDRQLLEAIRDPIGHMVRNAADHGIESPELRRQLGKQATGTIRLIARQSGGHIYIELGDDGRGIDPNKLRSRAVAMGLMTAAEAERLSDSAAQALIFEPGLSTASTVTAISGRGVGMDVVRHNLERIGGTVEVRSQPGHGTQFIIRVPLTLTIVPALIVGIGAQSYAINQSSIREIVRLRDESALSSVGGRPMIELRETLIPVIDMGRLFDNNQAAGERWGVIVEIAGIGRLALLVDAVNDQEEIVIKPVSPLIGTAGIYSGATVLGSGEAALVLDLGGIASMMNITSGAPANEAKADNSGRGMTDVDASWMIFEANGPTHKAIPLGLVARIENLDPQAVSFAGGRWLLRHDDQLLPIKSYAPDAPAREGDNVLILDDGRRRVALVVSRVVDIVSDAMTIEQASSIPGLAGLAMVDGQSIEVVDTCWLMGEADHSPRYLRGSILIVGNKQFATVMLKPLLESVGHATTIAADDTEAALLAARGESFDLILADGALSPPAGLSAVTLNISATKTGADPNDHIDPYDRTGLLDAVNGSLQRALGVSR